MDSFDYHCSLTKQRCPTNLGNDENQTRGCWVRSANATYILCWRPTPLSKPKTIMMYALTRLTKPRKCSIKENKTDQYFQIKLDYINQQPIIEWAIEITLIEYRPILAILNQRLSRSQPIYSDWTTSQSFPVKMRPSKAFSGLQSNKLRH